MTTAYQSEHMGEAHMRAAIVSARGEADLLVHRVGSLSLAKSDALWFMTGDKQDASVCIHLCSIGMAEVKVCFVDRGADAGWIKPHRLQGLGSC